MNMNHIDTIMGVMYVMERLQMIRVTQWCGYESDMIVVFTADKNTHITKTINHDVWEFWLEQ